MGAFLLCGPIFWEPPYPFCLKYPCATQYMARLGESTLRLLKKRKREAEANVPLVVGKAEQSPKRDAPILDEREAPRASEHEVKKSARSIKPTRYLTRPSRHPLAGKSPKRKRFAFNKADMMRVPSRYNNPISGLEARTLAEQADRRKNQFVANKARDMHTQMILRSGYPQVRVKRERLIAVVDERVNAIANETARRSAEKSALVLKFMLEQSRILARSTWIRILIVNAYNFRKKESLFLALDASILSFMINMIRDLQTLRESGIRMIHSRHVLHLLNDVWPARWRTPVFRYMPDASEGTRRLARTAKNTNTAEQGEDDTNKKAEHHDDDEIFTMEVDKEGNAIEPSSEEDEEDDAESKHSADSDNEEASE